MLFNLYIYIFTKPKFYVSGAIDLRLSAKRKNPACLEESAAKMRKENEDSTSTVEYRLKESDYKNQNHPSKCISDFTCEFF